MSHKTQTANQPTNQQFKSQRFIWHIDSTLSGATTAGLSGRRSDGNKRLLLIP